MSKLRRQADHWLDLMLASALLIACEVEAAIDLQGDRSHDHWPLAVNAAIIAVMTVPVAWRRRTPLASTSVVIISLVLLVGVGASDIHNLNSPQLLLFIAPYSVAAYSPRLRAALGLTICVAAIGVLHVLTSFGAASWIFSLAACGGSWAAGRILRVRRALAVELEYTTDRIAAERAGRELLAIAEQRTRIARELQTLVANSVSAMIVQTQAAHRLLDQNPDQADAAMATVEDTGRQALAEMRRILGVLRHPDDGADLMPQPGVGQILGLLERERRTRPGLTLQVEGDPGPLPASVDVGIYRILEDALHGLPDQISPIDIRLRFGTQDVELNITINATTIGTEWPPIATRERVTLCQGAADLVTLPGPAQHLVVRLPTVFEGARI